MQLGKMYCLNDAAKAKEKERAKKWSWNDLGYTILFHQNRNGHNNYISAKYPLDLIIVPIEIYTTTNDGAPLNGKSSRRINALMEDGCVGTIYLDEEDWEMVG